MAFIKCNNCGYELSRMKMIGTVLGKKRQEEYEEEEEEELSGPELRQPLFSDFSSGYLNGVGYKCPKCGKVDWESNKR